MENVVIPWTSLVERSDSFQLGDFGEKEESSLKNVGARIMITAQAPGQFTQVRALVCQTMFSPKRRQH